MKKKIASKGLKPKQFSSFSPRVRSRHKTHDAIRGKLGYFPMRSIIRFGSDTPTSAVFPRNTVGQIVEINPVEGVKNSANKLLMKQRFQEAGVRTARWCKAEDNAALAELKFPVVTKHIYGSRGTGNKFHKDLQSVEQWKQGKNLSHYIIEEYFSGVREYRLHVSHNGCFYTCRKMLKTNTPEAERWYRNDENSVWIMDTNPNFDRPVNWAAIEAECVKALQAVGLDVAAFDVRVQSARNSKDQPRENPEFIILESNSAPSFGDVTTEKYLGVLPALLREKMHK